MPRCAIKLQAVALRIDWMSQAMESPRGNRGPNGTLAHAADIESEYDPDGAEGRPPPLEWRFVNWKVS